MAERDLARDLEAVREYSRSYYGEVLQSYERLARYRPDVLVDWIDLRRSVFEGGGAGGLGLRDLELISTAIEVIAHKGPVVAQMTAAQAIGVYQVREVFEGLAARLFAEYASDADRQQLREVFDRFASATSAVERVTQRSITARRRP